jgi:hypothetical protein
MSANSNLPRRRHHPNQGLSNKRQYVVFVLEQPRTATLQLSHVVSTDDMMIFGAGARQSLKEKEFPVYCQMLIPMLSACCQCNID